MANLRLKLSEITTRVADFLGWTDGTEPTGTNLTNCQDIVARGYRRFLYPIDRQSGEAYEWSFLREPYVHNIQNGVWKYQLPENFSEILTPPTFDDDDGYRKLMKRTPEEILGMRSSGTVNSAPYFYAVAPAHFDEQVGSVDELWVWPEPDTAYLLKFFIKLDPLKPTDSNDFILGGVRGSEAMLENCLAVAEQQEDGQMGIHTQLAEQLTQDLIKADMKHTEKVTIGNLYNNQEVKFVPHSNATIDLNNIYPNE